MSQAKKTRVAVNGYGVIGKRVADAVARQDDMELAGVADISVDWRPRMAMQKGFRLYGATEEHAEAMRKAGLDVAGNLDDLLGASDLVVDCPPRAPRWRRTPAGRVRRASSRPLPTAAGSPVDRS